MNGAGATLFYAFKTASKANPYKTQSILLILSILIPSYTLRIAERPMDPTSGQNLSNFTNCVWCIINTITTVGYGDKYATTNIGRVISVLMMIDGMYVVSMFVVSLSDLLAFTKGELKSYDYLNKLLAKEKLRKQTARALEMGYFKIKTEKNYPSKVKKLLKAY